MPHGAASVGALARKESSRLVLPPSACGSPTDHHSASGTRVSNICQGMRFGSSAAQRRTRARSLRGSILARPSPSCTHVDDRLRLSSASPPRRSETEKKESTGRRLSQHYPPYATPSSNSSLDHRRNDARIAENRLATSSGLSKSAKVVLGSVCKSRVIRSTRFQP